MYICRCRCVTPLINEGGEKNSVCVGAAGTSDSLKLTLYKKIELMHLLRLRAAVIPHARSAEVF